MSKSDMQLRKLQPANEGWGFGACRTRKSRVSAVPVKSNVSAAGSPS